MSSKQVKDALLEGFLPPIFPALLTQLLRTQLETDTVTGQALELVGRGISGFKFMECPETSDGYQWFRGLYFFRNDTVIAVLFPWAQDFDAPDGNKSDRSIAIYSMTEISDEEIGTLIMELQEQMYILSNERNGIWEGVDTPFYMPIDDLKPPAKIWKAIKKFLGISTLKV